jgi:hypothetical protein
LQKNKGAITMDIKSQEVVSDDTAKNLSEVSESKDVVKYNTYKHALADAKNHKARADELQAKLADFERKEQELVENRLKEQGEYKKLLEIERKKRKEEEDKRTHYEKSLLDAHKLSAVREKIPGKLKRNEYYSFIDTDKIILDHETGEIDQNSLEAVVNSFVQDHGALIERQGNVGLPQNAASGSTNNLTYEAWLALPLKEQKLRRKEVMDNWKSKKF